MTKQKSIPSRVHAHRAFTLRLFAGWLAVIGTSTAAVAATKTDGARDVDPVALVEAADRIRFPKEAFQVGVNVINHAPGKTPDQRVYQVLSKGNSNTIVRTLKPASEAGQMMLMKDRELWVFLPSVSQPVRMPLSQKLTGQVANGDLARANLSGDYSPKLLRTETIEGEDHAVMELTAVDRGVTYQRVIYWVSLKTNRPYKAEFYTISGRLMKTCLYTDFKTMDGKIRPTRLIMKDALKKDEHSEMVYVGMKRRELADKIFTKDYLKKLQN
ncbi:MAG: outer membrane lipoprotein-sorting protein [Gammaproteobacteria bacterium]